MKHMRMFIAAGALLVSAAGAEAQQGQIVFINSQQIVASAPGAREAQTTLESEMATMRTEVQQMEATLDSMMTVYDQRQVMLSPEAKRQMQDDIRTRQREFQQRAMQLDQQASQRQAQLLQPIMARIQEVIDALRAERGYALVLDAAEGGIVSADPSLDITQEILNRLRSTASSQ